MAEFDRQKLKELMLYVADRSVDDSGFGATKLNKILFFSDFIAFGALGHAITGAVYRKLDYGHVPRVLPSVQAELVADSDAMVAPKAVASMTQKRLIALRKPDLSLFTADEISLVDNVMAALGAANATTVSGLSHEWSFGWQAAAVGADIPYETVFWHAPGPESRAFERGCEIAKERGLVAA